MENEELEQIPWSALVAEVDDRPDRKWYMVGAGVALLALGWLAIQFLVPGGQPTPEAAPTTITEANPPTTDIGSALVVSEDDLRSIEGSEGVDDDQRMAIARAEWFITDWHTSDGSEETLEASAAALLPSVALTDRADREEQTYVEWARATSVSQSEGGFEVTVAYRTVSTSDGLSYSREPVRADVVDVVFVDGVPLVAAVPSLVSDPWARSG